MDLIRARRMRTEKWETKLGLFGFELNLIFGIWDG